MGRDPKATVSAVIMGLGALVVGIALILPWFSVLGLGVNAFQIAGGAGYIYLLPVAVLGGLAWAVFVGYKGSATTAIALAGVGIAVLALLPVVILFIQLQPAASSTGGVGDLGAAVSGLAMQMLGIGFWVTIIGAVVMLVGALISFGARQTDSDFTPVTMQATMVATSTQMAPPTMVAPPPVAPAPPARTTVSSTNVSSNPPIDKTKQIGGAPAPAAWLVVQGGPRHGQQFALKRGDNNLGRNGNQADVVIDDSSVSGQHARVRYENGQFWLYDLASTNGTFINNGRIQKQILYDNDRVRLGEVTLVFKMVDQRK